MSLCYERKKLANILKKVFCCGGLNFYENNEINTTYLNYKTKRVFTQLFSHRRKLMPASVHFGLLKKPCDSLHVITEVNLTPPI